MHHGRAHLVLGAVEECVRREALVRRITGFIGRAASIETVRTSSAPTLSDVSDVSRAS